MSDLLSIIFQPIYGKPCWQVQQGYGSFLTLEFGDPHLTIREPRQVSEQATEKVRRNAARRHVYVHGSWHLWIYMCDWRVSLLDQELANSSSNRRIIKNAMIELDGQALSKVSINSAIQTVFEFDLGGRLEVFPNHNDFDKTSDLWLLYEPAGNVFALRADGYYSHQPGDTPREHEEWVPLF